MGFLAEKPKNFSFQVEKKILMRDKIREEKKNNNSTRDVLRYV